jgi:hypothetical protein
MAVCEACGTRYTPTAESLDCPKCGPVPRPPTRGAAGRTQPTSARVSKRPAQAPVAAASRAPKKEVDPGSDDAPRGHRPRGEEKLMDDVTKYALIATLGLALVVGMVVTCVHQRKADDERVRQAYEAEIAQLHHDLQALNVNDAAAAERIVKLAKEKESRWIEHSLAPEIASLVARAKANLSAAQERRDALEMFTGLEEELKKPDVPSERLKEVRRQLDESEARLADGGPELVARLGLARVSADQRYANRLIEEARARAKEAGANSRSSLVRYQGVEDELKSLLDHSFVAKNKEAQDFYTPLYKQVVTESDTLAAALFQSEGESLAWTDCLAAPQDKYWNASSARGFSYKCEGGTLMLVGPDRDAGRMAVISIGDREQWRHFQVDLEFVVEKGDMDMFFRLGKGPNQNTVSYPLKTTPPEGILAAGKRYSGRISVVGSKFSVRFAGEDIDTPQPRDDAISWVMTRKGALGFVLAPESRAKFTRLKVRELR